jgi:hypothetical protein
VDRLTVLGLIGSLAVLAAPVGATEPPEDPAGALEAQLEALAHVDVELAQAQRELETAPESQREALRTRINDLKAGQAALLDELEALAGPLPPAVEPPPPNPLEEHLDAQLRRHDAILESDVDRRLPRP